MNHKRAGIDALTGDDKTSGYNKTLASGLITADFRGYGYTTNPGDAGGDGGGGGWR